ncbi:hypothetical protein Hanom_Chr12g01108941 [Helianthus anomalus]
MKKPLISYNYLGVGAMKCRKSTFRNYACYIHNYERYKIQISHAIKHENHGG